eukprot:9631957-Alexandrium_andersonii.AAC.1
MSASLVGSEMCIRDRASVRRLGPQGRALLKTDDEPALVDLRRAVAERSVSYTHLTLPTICSV